MRPELTLEERLELARNRRREGANCSQATVAAFPDVFQLPQDVAQKLTIGLGGGVGGLQNVCGVITALAILEGIHADTTTGKAQVYKIIRQLGTRFKERTGSLICAELKSPGASLACNDLIAEGIRIYHEYLLEEE